MSYCSKCGTKNEDNAVYCQHCGEKINFSEDINEENKRIDSLWLLVAILIPIIGILGGLYYAWKGRKGSWAVVGLGLFVWAFFMLIILSRYFS